MTTMRSRGALAFRALAAAIAIAVVAPAHGRTDGALDVLRWEELPGVPDASGFAGHFAGMSNGALVVAGGANFPDGRPWDGHPKVWHDRVFVLRSPTGLWRLAPTPLPRPTAYGVSATWRDGVVCAGGGDGDTHFDDCFIVRRTAADITIEPLPPLPVPMAFHTGALLGDVLYVMGGIDRPGAVRCLDTFAALDLAAPAGERAWIELETWPGPERQLAVAGAQDGSVFLFGGVRLTKGLEGGAVRIRPYLFDAYRFTPEPGGVAGHWTAVAPLPTPLAAAPSPAVAIGPSHLLIAGGDDGGAPGTLRDEHPGFSNAVLAYHTITDTWTGAGTMRTQRGPDPARFPQFGVWAPVTAPTVRWDDRIVIPSGEARPGVRTPRVIAAVITGPEPAFGRLNMVVLGVYLLSLLVMGVFFARREKTTGDFFLGGRRVPWWAAGVSIFATQLSAITFLAIPAKAYAEDWLYFIQNLGIIAIAPIVVVFYLPKFRRMNVTTAYEYLEHRFNRVVRLFGALSFIAFQLARMAIVMFLPALALAAVTGLPVATCVLVMGVLCTIYTVLGGIEAVIWTDVLQVVVLFGGAVIALGIVVAGTDGGLGGVVDVARAHDKLRMVDMSWDWTGPALGVILLGAIFNNLVPYTSDQAVVQRYLTTADEKRAARAIWTGALLAFPASVVFFFVGTALFAFYSAAPERLNPLAATDQVFAWFIVNEMPAGVAGVVIAGIFAAAMSSLDSSMNAIAAVVTTDLLRRKSDARRDLTLARWITVLVGGGGTAAALLMARAEVRSMLDEFLAYVGLLGGTMAGLFALGIFVRRANATGAIVGALAGVAALVYVKLETELSGLLYAAVGMTTCFVVGAMVSVVVPGGGRGGGAPGDAGAPRAEARTT